MESLAFFVFFFKFYSQLFFARFLHWTVCNSNLNITPFLLLNVAFGLKCQSKCPLLADFVLLVAKFVKVGVFAPGVDASMSSKVLLKRILAKLITKHKFHSMVQKIC